MVAPIRMVNADPPMRSTLPEDVDRRELILELARHPAVERVWLFGSRARGDHFERSDIDLAIKAPSMDDSDWVRIKLEFEDEAPTLLLIDLVRIEDAPEHLREANSPKAVLQQAYRVGWPSDEPRWLKILEDRNLTSYAYKEQLALEIYGRIPDHHAALRAAFEGLQAQLRR